MIDTAVKIIEQQKAEIEHLRLLLLKKNCEIQTKDEQLEKAKTIIEEKDSTIKEKDSTIKEKEKIIEENKIKLDKLINELLLLRRLMFGQKSERFIPADPNQLRLDFGGLSVLPQEKEQYEKSSEEIISYKKSKPEKEKSKPARQQLPEHLERIDEIIEPKGVDLTNAVKIGEEITEVLEYVPGKIYVRRIIRPKYAMPSDQGVKIGDLPSLPLPKSNAGASLLAALLTGKYVDHLPFYRQLEIFKRQNIHIPSSTVNGWFFSAVSLLRPLYDKLKELVLSSDYICADESTIPVVNDEKNKTVKAYLWIARDVMHNLVFFHYDQGSRSEATAVNLFKDYKGAIQSDGYVVYEFYEQKEGVLLLGCWAHARRKFEEALKNDEVRAKKALEQIQMLYAIERMAQDQSLSFEEKAALRVRLAYPILSVFEKWLYQNIKEVLPSSKIGKALSYTYRIYPRLSRYVLDGRYRIDNNLAENSIRPIALGRKNYLFCKNHESAQMAAIMYSLLGTCKLQNINPVEWLTDVFNRIDDKHTKVQDLLPHKWKKRS